jgi:SAM-dependent methyltransferase
LLARHGAEAVGIDISEVSIGNAKSKAIQEGVGNNSRFFVMDAEELQFDADCFDLVICGGVLHHLEVEKAYSELARVLKPDGEIICGEPLVHNPFIQHYRKRTPHLRTEWETEHILSKDSLELAKNYFGKVDVRCFHLAALAAVPFRNTPVFKFVLGFLEAADGFLLRLPLLKWQAWQVVFVLSQPKKPVIWEGALSC